MVIETKHDSTVSTKAKKEKPTNCLFLVILMRIVVLTIESVILKNKLAEFHLQLHEQTNKFG